MMENTIEIVEEPPPPSSVHVVGDKMYIAVGTDIKESKLVVTWALRNSGGRKICILHVHEPAQRIPIMGTKFPVSQVDEPDVRAYREVERQELNKLLQNYRTMCSSAGVHAEVLHIEINSIGKGIVELIKQHGIKKLVMGAAADRHYSKKMKEPKSKKAIYVHLQAPMSCHIWFICEGNLVHTREGRSEGVSMEIASSTLQASPTPNAETGQSSYLRSHSIAYGANDLRRLTNSGRNCPKVLSSWMSFSTSAPDCSSGVSSSITEGSSLEPLNSHCSSRSSVNMADDSALSPVLTKEDSRPFSLPPSALAKASERLYAEDVRQRKEVEEALARGKEELDLRKEQAEASADTLAAEFFYEFSFSEIEEATSRFDLSLKIGQGGYGDIYKGLLRHTEVAIKILHSNSRQGASEFQQEVNVLGKLRHPNLVTLIGACPEFFILVYEYLPNGSLEDRLRCKDNSPPLSWQTRIRIAIELCSALIFLHSGNPKSIVHGDIKPANILLDSNFVSKLSDFGICRILDQNEYSSNNTLCRLTVPKGTVLYMDPEFFATGEITPKSDVYSFGIILLQLLTGRPAVGIANEVRYALDEGNLKNLLDPRAGDWPFVQAQQLAHIAMRCSEMNRRSRPDLALDVWKVLEQMSPTVSNEL